MNLVELAKKTVEVYIKENKIIPIPDDLPAEFLARKAGTFVTITKDGELRGCIGTYLPTKINVAEEIIRNAIAAATEDYRFGPVEKEELPYLSYTVYILSYPEPVKDIKDPTKFSEEKFKQAGLDPKKFGIIVKTRPIFPSKNLGGQAKTDVVFNGHMVAKTGLLLPDLEGVDTIEKQISIACQKGGIDLNREKTLIYRFAVEKYE